MQLEEYLSIPYRLVAYSAPGPDGKWRRIEVKVARPGLSPFDTSWLVTTPSIRISLLPPIATAMTTRRIGSGEVPAVSRKIVCNGECVEKLF